MNMLLVTSPLLFALMVLVPNIKFRNVFAVIFVIILSSLSVTYILPGNSIVAFSLPHILHKLFILIDSALLLYFLWQGVLKRHMLVTLLASVQILLYAIVVFLSPMIVGNDIFIDKVSSVMYLVINIVGGTIIIFALKYIEEEQFSRFKKNGFISMLFLFLAVMNFIVSTNNIEIFFMLFELTTLFSYILIAYRGDELSVKNSLRALWMNQIGGVAILLALLLSIFHCDTVYFDQFIENMDDLYLLPIVFLIIASFVKGASIPFDKWLLGAMVAPTPVSAILHSATMVKIAPYLMLKIAPAMSEFVSVTVTLIGTFVFFAASLLALSKDYFKEILGLSTIAFLALMMALAAIGTDEAVMACLVLIVFHAISKAMLFLQAGIMEKTSHLKYVDDINGLINHSPLVVFFIVIGFASLTLPPFGAFIGKFMAIESITNEIIKTPLYIPALIFLVLGSVFLILLYFKVLTKLFAKDVDVSADEKIKLSKFYTFPSYMLLVLLIVGIYFSFERELLSSIEIIVPFVLIAVVPFLFMLFVFKKAHRVKEYNCGEKDEIKLGMYYFDIDESYKNAITYISIASMIILVLGVLL